MFCMMRLTQLPVHDAPQVDSVLSKPLKLGMYRSHLTEWMVVILAAE